jgi:hypothetical protein
MPYSQIVEMSASCLSITFLFKNLERNAGVQTGIASDWNACEYYIFRKVITNQGAIPTYANEFSVSLLRV